MIPIIKTTLLLHIVSAVIIYNPTLASPKKPDWVKSRPVNQFYFIGIGSAAKNDSVDYVRQAKAKALNDLASEIEVNISSEFINTMLESHGMVSDEVTSEIRLSTQIELEGYTLVDSWENSDEYWVYYRLSREYYFSQKWLKMQAAMKLSLDLYDKGKFKAFQGETVDALRYYLQSISPLTPFLHQDLKIEYQDKEIFLLNEIYGSILNTLNSIKLNADSTSHEAEFGGEVADPLIVVATLVSENGVETPVSNLPLEVNFTKGTGDLLQTLTTNDSGFAESKVAKIKSAHKVQIVEMRLDTARIFTDIVLPNFLQKAFISSLPRTEFHINISGINVFVEAEETSFGQPLDIKYVEPQLKASLAENGFVFVDDTTTADILLTLRANARQGTNLHGLYTAFVDLNITMIDLGNNVELYGKSFHNIKGIQLNYENAGVQALINAASHVKNNIIPDLTKQQTRVFKQ